MRGPPLVLGLVASLALAAACSGTKPPQNVVLIVADTLRADLGKRIADFETPAIDALAQDGVAFSQAFSHAPMTLPSHAALFSARPPHAAGLVANEQDQVPVGLPLLAEHLQGQGFATRAVVSLWTLGTASHASGFERGFDHYDRDYFARIEQGHKVFERMERALDDLQGRRPFFLFAHFSDPHFPLDAHDRPAGHMVELLLDGERVAEFDVSNTVDFERTFELAPGEHGVVIQSEHSFTFFRHEASPPDGVDVVPLPEECRGGASSKSWRRLASKVTNRTDRTVPFRVRFQLSEEAPKDEQRARYPGEVAFADRWIGALVASLERRGLYDDSLVVFTSDHGEAFGEHGWWGHKENLYDELLHVPLIVKPPAGHAAREEIAGWRDRLVRHEDVVPTMLEILGLAELPGQNGRSLLADEPPDGPAEGSAEGSADGRAGGPRDAGRELLAVSRLVRVPEQGRFEVREDLIALRDARYKLVYRAVADCFEMYDLEHDPDELVDVFRERRAERPGWEQRLRAVFATMQSIGTREVSSAERESLDALGYLGEAEEAAPCSEAADAQGTEKPASDS